MNQHSLVCPMSAMVFLTFVVLLVTFVVRVVAVLQGKMDARYFKTFSHGTPTDLVLRTTRHFSNLFELPVIFYLGCLLAMIQGKDSKTLTALAWTFVGARVAHAIIHITVNKIYPRLASYMVGVVALAAFWAVLFCCAN